MEDNQEAQLEFAHEKAPKAEEGGLAYVPDKAEPVFLEEPIVDQKDDQPKEEDASDTI